MSGWVSVKPGRKAKPATDPTPPSPALDRTVPEPAAAPEPPARPAEPARCCDNPAHAPGRPRRPQPTPVECSGCHGTGWVIDRSMSTTFNSPAVVSPAVFDVAQLFTPGAPREVPCWSCHGIGWVLPSPQSLPVFPSPAVQRPAPAQWWHPAPVGPTITC